MGKGCRRGGAAAIERGFMRDETTNGNSDLSLQTNTSFEGLIET